MPKHVLIVTNRADVHADIDHQMVALASGQVGDDDWLSFVDQIADADTATRPSSDRRRGACADPVRIIRAYGLR